MPENTGKILWFFHEHDLINLRDNLNNRNLIKYLENENYSQSLKDNNLLMTKMIKDKIELIYHNKDPRYISNKFMNFLKLTNTRNKFLSKNYVSIKDDEIFNKFEKIVRLVKKKCEKKNIDFYFILLPGFSKYTNFYKNDMIYNKIKNIVFRNNINLIDIDEVFFKLEDNPKKYFPFESFNHYNSDGYKRISEILLEIILKK